MKAHAIFLAAAIALAAAPAAHADHQDDQHRYMADVDQHGGIGASQSYAPGGQTLGDAICADINKGNVAANEVIDVANDVTSLHGSMSKAEVAVYWAITDLCPNQMSQRQDHWRDGN
ncbi:hypothetical protein MXEN_11911 [Mycobacterium xenopi RIVM700367]|uniref:DUF732 domain-containing protein n=1 Tax=Mycobacterium xenopi TaxID=1789 RepID=UPI00025ADF5A|nr:DUF732 domain-containing protein [Mycobacterium xenopi]EID12911.1 hypothetical protein MXEN_11911 [Mycobacterium xenopi RIVM700367]